MTGDNNARRIHIYFLNPAQYEVEVKYQEDQINIVRVVRDKYFFLNDETIDRNITHLPILFEAEPQ